MRLLALGVRKGSTVVACRAPFCKKTRRSFLPSEGSLVELGSLVWFRPRRIRSRQARYYEIACSRRKKQGPHSSSLQGPPCKKTRRSFLTSEGSLVKLGSLVWFSLRRIRSRRARPDTTRLLALGVKKNKGPTVIACRAPFARRLGEVS